MGNSYISILDLDWENGEREAEHPQSEPRLSNRLKTDRVDCAPS